MTRSFGIIAALAAALAAPSLAEAQAVHRHASPSAEGRQIIVHPRESWLTAGTGASVGSFNGYVLDTFGGAPTTFMPNVDHTTVGVRGLTRIPNNFTVPNCCLP